MYHSSLKPLHQALCHLFKLCRQNIAAIQNTLVKLQSEVLHNKVACKKKDVESDPIEATDRALFTGMMVCNKSISCLKTKFFLVNILCCHL